MRVTVSLLLAVAVLGMLLVNAQAADKAVTLKGKILCAKCTLKETKKCQTAIKVNQDGKDVVYYFLDKGNKEEYHEMVCGGGEEEGTVIGTVSEKDGKKYITPTKVTFAKK